MKEPGFDYNITWKRFRDLLLPCAWHHTSLMFLRSRKSLELERQRQLQAGYWFVVHPCSPFNHYWDIFMWVMSIFSAIYVPLQVFAYCPHPADPVILMSDFIWLCDIIFIFCSGYHEEEYKEIVLEPKKIVKNYLKGAFIIDLIAVCPWQLYQPFPDCRYPTHTIFFPIKMIRWQRVHRILGRILDQFGCSYSTTVLTMVTSRLLVFCHWMTYWQYQVPAFCIHYYDLKHLGKGEAAWLDRLQVNYTINPVIRYTANLYHVFGRSIGVGYQMPMQYHNKPEMIQNSITSIVSLMFYIFCFMVVLRLVLCSRNHQFMFNGRLRDLEKYMTLKRLPQSLKQKIRLFINYKFGQYYTDEVAILKTINEQIKQDINMQTCQRLVINLPLFKGFPISLINTIIFSLKREAYIPGQDVITCGQRSTNLYFIYYGTVAVVDENGKEIHHLNDNASFGEAAILYPDAVETTTVTALEITEIYTLNNEDFEKCLLPYPNEIREQLAENHRRRVSQIFPNMSITSNN